MNSNTSDITEKIRQQFDFGPYPRSSLEQTPKDNLRYLYWHNLATPYYLRNQKFWDSQDKVILDAGCGAGYKSLALAEANPGAKIVGIDLSEKSVELARIRLKHYGFEEAEFHQLSLYDLPSLGLKFDYINCDEVLYLVPDIVRGLQAMKGVLKPDGIIRTNLHSLYQRGAYFRAQELFKRMGLMDENPEEMQMEIVTEIMQSFNPRVDLKQKTWPKKMDDPKNQHTLLSNQLLVGDRGFTIPDVFQSLQAANLDFIEMLNWQEWNVERLFQEPENLPVFLALALPEATREEQLTFFELMHPIFRLLDFWCGHPIDNSAIVPVSDWTDSDWENATVYLHPLLHKDPVKTAFKGATEQLQAFPLSNILPIPGVEALSLDITLTTCLFPPLWESPQPFKQLVERWQRLRPIDLATLEPTTPQTAFSLLKNTLTGLEEFGYIFLEQ
ncbi:methyltransferase domain-containing protein [Spirulina sp. CS-785/01]|uniref:class I SAM-dependent methyltransferase n=1 Tax=Spirulina sp. CS-785/01 TaxID=3021716 RepID=UPI00232BBB8C|nr:methyltransferase domain-containing protein [Spirulina sp. CS-785/01]MDB9312414.1 methyltransferase domain-containing protein [Spirulina sp. CS-785/01]